MRPQWASRWQLKQQPWALDVRVQKIVDTLGLMAFTPLSTSMICASWSQLGLASGRQPHGPWNFSTVTSGKRAISASASALTGPLALLPWKKVGSLSQENRGPRGAATADTATSHAIECILARLLRE